MSKLDDLRRLREASLTGAVARAPAADARAVIDGRPARVPKAKSADVAQDGPEAKPPYDRNAAHKEYMRDYMKRRRARIKAAKT